MTGRAAIVGLTGLTFAVGVAARFFRGRRRFGSFSFKNQTRSDSSEIVTPNVVSDRAISLIDAPARRSVSKTSRYGSSAAKRRGRSCRPSATNCASLRAFSVGTAVMSAAHAVGPLARGVETTGVSRSTARGSAGIGGVSAGTAVGPAGGGTVESWARESCSPAGAGASIVCMAVKYRASRGRAMGARRSESKPEGLDVGVLPHGFSWILRDNSQHQRRLLWTYCCNLQPEDLLGVGFVRRCREEVDADAATWSRFGGRSVLRGLEAGASC